MLSEICMSVIYVESSPFYCVVLLSINMYMYLLEWFSRFLRKRNNLESE